MLFAVCFIDISSYPYKCYTAAIIAEIEIQRKLCTSFQTSIASAYSLDLQIFY